MSDRPDLPDPADEPELSAADRAALAELFATALGQEPDPVVTPLTVQAEVYQTRGESRRRRTRAVGWLVAAAVAAVVITGGVVTLRHDSNGSDTASAFNALGGSAVQAYSGGNAAAGAATSASAKAQPEAAGVPSGQASGGDNSSVGAGDLSTTAAGSAGGGQAADSQADSGETSAKSLSTAVRSNASCQPLPDKLEAVVLANLPAGSHQEAADPADCGTGALYAGRFRAPAGGTLDIVIAKTDPSCPPTSCRPSPAPGAWSGGNDRYVVSVWTVLPLVSPTAEPGPTSTEPESEIAGQVGDAVLAALG